MKERKLINLWEVILFTASCCTTFYPIQPPADLLRLTTSYTIRPRGQKRHVNQLPHY
jgi:hypothetical protein